MKGASRARRDPEARRVSTGTATRASILAFPGTTGAPELYLDGSLVPYATERDWAALRAMETRLAAIEQRTRSRRRRLAGLLSVALALAPALALADAGTPASIPEGGGGQAAASPPGRAVELQQCPAADGRVPDGGCAVPYSGSLVDKERMGVILAKRIAAELECDALRLSEQDARARRDAAERERDGRPSWGALVGVAGAALVLGLVAGVVGVVVVQDRVR